MNKKMFLGIGIFWLIIVIGFVAFKEFTLITGKEVLLKTMPVDPRDLFRGDYVVLNYDISALDFNSLPTDSANFNDSDRVYVTLKIEDKYGVPTGIYRDPPKEGLFIKGTVKDVQGNGLIIEYGIESYFVPEGKGWEIQRQSGRNLEVKVAIDKFGNAVIKSLLIEGKEINFES